MTDRDTMAEVTQAEVEAALAAFNGGLARQNDERNARGYTTFYHPQDSMRAALEAFARHRFAQASADRPVSALVERECGECGGDGIAEHIDHMARPCDARHGEGVLTFTAVEAALLDNITALEAKNARQEAAMRPLQRIALRIIEDVSRIENPDRLSPRTVCGIVFDARKAMGADWNEPVESVRARLLSNHVGRRPMRETTNESEQS